MTKLQTVAMIGALLLGTSALAQDRPKHDNDAIEDNDPDHGRRDRLGRWLRGDDGPRPAIGE